MIPELSQKQLVDVAGKRTTNNLGTNEGDRTNSNPDAEKRLWCTLVPCCSDLETPTAKERRAGYTFGRSMRENVEIAQPKQQHIEKE
jgi:hypothetical protein